MLKLRSVQFTFAVENSGSTISLSQQWTVQSTCAEEASVKRLSKIKALLVSKAKAFLESKWSTRLTHRLLQLTLTLFQPQSAFG